MLHIIPHYNRDLTEPCTNTALTMTTPRAAEVIIQRAAQSKAAELEKLAEELGYDLTPKADTEEPAADY